MDPGFRWDADLIAEVASFSDRDRQQRVDLPAGEHDEFPGEFPPRLAPYRPIDIAPGSEQDHPAVLHRAHDQEVGFEIDAAALLLRDSRAREQATVTLRPVDGGLG